MHHRLRPAQAHAHLARREGAVQHPLALQAAKLDQQFPAGVLTETQSAMMLGAMPPVTPDRLLAGLQKVFRQANERGITTVFVTGLATDFCVAWTALDARKAGFTTYVIEDATRAIDLNGSLAAAWKQMAEAGVKRIQASDIA